MTVIELEDVKTEPLSLAETKAWCRIDRADEDDLLETLISAARETVERETRLALVRRSFRLALSELPPDRRVTLPRRPFVAVTAISAFGTGGTQRALPIGEAVIERFGTSEALRLSEMAATLGSGGLTVDITAGYAPGAVPEALKLALKRIVALGYETRAPLGEDRLSGGIPLGAQEAIAAFRELRL